MQMAAYHPTKSKNGTWRGPRMLVAVCKVFNKLAAEPTFRCMMPPTTLVRNSGVARDI